MAVDSTDTAVIGAGVIGLAMARALALAGREVVVLEASAAIGQGISARSSEVVHAGLHYPPGSMKARCCVRGKELLYAYCKTRGVPHRRIGKLIVAAGEAQVPRLAGIRDNAAASGVHDLELIDPHQVARMEPQVRADAALWSPSSGIIDSHALMLALQADLEAAGGTVALNSRVVGGHARAKGCRLRVRSGGESTLEASLVINSAGLGAASVAAGFEGLSGYFIPEIYFVKGHYFGYRGSSPFKHLVYPLPDPDGLGVHATLDLAGALRFGPDSEYCERADYRFDERRKARFAESVGRWYPGLEAGRLQPGYVGVRPKLAGPGAGFADFQISGPEDHGIPGLINLFGIESPGLTACLALAQEVASRS